ncbi:hypothetical protein PROFUN_07636 [Planoprotostelium fungivorum]|uniref:Uncharacterized protein n=1 Tax=Planoprotostelium fungivorum TaxID=1890364 RepID=A0A2P6NK43_9EUKA|nr:hypothetical protein PROFUN_07636 [Planoprotostelium fungivorum]
MSDHLNILAHIFIASESDKLIFTDEQLDAFKPSCHLAADFPAICASVGVFPHPGVTVRPFHRGGDLHSFPQTQTAMRPQSAASPIPKSTGRSPTLPKGENLVEIRGVIEMPLKGFALRYDCHEIENWKELLSQLSLCRSVIELDIDYCTSFSHLLWSFPSDAESTVNLLSQGVVGGAVLTPLSVASNSNSLPTAGINREFAPLATVISSAGEFLSKSFAHLQSLSLRSNHTSPREAKIYAELILRNRSITFLNLWDNNIGDEGAMAIGEALRYNYILLYLNLAKNQIGPTGADYISLSLGRFRLTPNQAFERKKLIRELDKRKKEAISRKRRVNKGKSKAKPMTASGAQEEPAAATPAQKKSPTPASKTDDEAYEIEMLIQELEVTETEGLSYGTGNRSLVYLNITQNDFEPADLYPTFHRVNQINPIIQRILLDEENV